MRIGWQILVGGGMLGFLLTLGLGTVLPRRWAAPPTTQCPIPIYLHGGAMHTDIVLPIQSQYVDWSKHLPLPKIGAEDARYLSIGFGEQSFYMGEPIPLLKRLPDGLRALFWVNPSILFVNPKRQVPRTALCVGLTASQYRELVEHIKTSFRRGPQGKPISLGRGFQRTGLFFQGRQAYSVLFTCNHWTAQGLDRAGVPTPLLPLLTQGILWHGQNACPCPQP